VHVVLDHPVRVLVLARDTPQFRLDVGAKVHAGAVPPKAENVTWVLCRCPSEFRQSIR